MSYAFKTLWFLLSLKTKPKQIVIYLLHYIHFNNLDAFYSCGSKEIIHLGLEAKSISFMESKTILTDNLIGDLPREIMDTLEGDMRSVTQLDTL